jgi:hypothetical protein
LPENEQKFVDYMQNYGSPNMSKYCKNWHLFKLSRILKGDNIPQYIGYFEIPDPETFFKSDPPKEMQETMKEAAKVCSNIKNWLGEQIDANC